MGKTETTGVGGQIHGEVSTSKMVRENARLLPQRVWCKPPAVNPAMQPIRKNCFKTFHPALKAGVALAVLASAVPGATADVIPYPSPGTINITTYFFTAATTGNVTAYFAGASASYTDLLGMYVNGVFAGTWGLNNQTSSLGATVNLGHVKAGDSLQFAILNESLNHGTIFASTPSLSADGLNHAYATAYTDSGSPNLGGGIPAGVYIAFEDSPNGQSDFDYNDESFVIKNVTMQAAPEPTTARIGALMLVPLGIRAWRAFRRRHRKAAEA